MSEVKHTPGPWLVRTLENFGFNVVHYVGGDKFNIALVAKTGNEHDARLIAAAPDLLEALEAVNQVMFDGILNSDGRDIQSAIEKMCAAIAKAKGGDA